VRWFEVELERFLQVGQRFFFGFALACYVDFQALGDVPLPLTPSGRGEWPFHESDCPTIGDADQEGRLARRSVTVASLAVSEPRQ